MGVPRKRLWDTDDPEVLAAAVQANKEAEKDAVRFVAVNETFASKHLNPMQRWEDGTPNVRGQLTSLWVLGERPRREPIRYAPPPLREEKTPEPEPPCCAAPMCFEPGCGPWGLGGPGFDRRRNNAMMEETEPGSDFGRNGGGRNLDDFVDFDDSGSEDDYDKRGKADGVVDAMCAPFVGAAVGAVTGASSLLKRKLDGIGNRHTRTDDDNDESDQDQDTATRAMRAERKAVEAQHKEIQAQRDKYYASQRTERALNGGGCLGSVMRILLTAAGRKPLGPPPPPPSGKRAEETKEAEEKEKEAAEVAAAAAPPAVAGEREKEAAGGGGGGSADAAEDDADVAEDDADVDAVVGNVSDSDDDMDKEWGRRKWRVKQAGYLKVRAAVLGAWHPRRGNTVHVSFQKPSVQVMSILAAATAPLLWRALRVFAPPPLGVTGIFAPSEFELLTMTPSQMTAARNDARLEAMTHRKLPHLPSVVRDVLPACLAWAFLSAAHQQSHAVAGGRKLEVFFTLALLPGFRRAVASERTRRLRRRRALVSCGFLSARRKAKDVEAEKWEDVEFERPRPAPKTVEQLQLQAQLQLQLQAQSWDDAHPSLHSETPHDSETPHNARQHTPQDAAAAAAEEGAEEGADAVKAADEVAKEDNKAKTVGGEKAAQGGDVVAGWLWGMVSAVDWSGPGVGVGAGAAVAGESRDVWWSSQVNPDNDSTSDALYDASVARALKGCVKRHHRALRGLRAYWPDVESLRIDMDSEERGGAYRARAATDYDDDDTERPIGPQPPRMNVARA